MSNCNFNSAKKGGEGQCESKVSYTRKQMQLSLATGSNREAHNPGSSGLQDLSMTISPSHLIRILAEPAIPVNSYSFIRKHAF